MESGIGLILIFLVILFVVLGIIAFPIKLAAAAMGAQNTGTGSCLLALIIAGFLHSVGLAVPCAGSIVAFILSTLGFAWILGTNFWRAIGIQVLSIIFASILILILTAVFGVSITDVLSNFR